MGNELSVNQREIEIQLGKIFVAMMERKEFVPANASLTFKRWVNKHARSQAEKMILARWTLGAVESFERRLKALRFVLETDIFDKGENGWHKHQ